MRNPIWTAGLASLVLLAVGSSAMALDFDGQWRGRGNAASGDCAAFNISVSVQNGMISGKVAQDERDYKVTGYITSEGQLRGEVSYLWLTVAELNENITRDRGFGTWRTFKGPNCMGRFAVQKIRGYQAAETQLDLESFRVDR